MASVNRIAEFSIKTGNWSSFIERLEMYFLVNDIEDRLRLPTLLTVIGDEVYELLSNLVNPKKPAELEYKEVVKILHEYFQPSPSALAERYIFRLRRQKEGENVLNYVAELKKLAKYCNFGEYVSENLRDQFVCGLKDDVIRQRLFTEDESLSFVAAVKIASTFEAAERNAAIVVGTSEAEIVSPVNNDLHVFHQEKSGDKRKEPGQSKMKRGSRIVTKLGRCIGCGSNYHDLSTCRFRCSVCCFCKKRGHIQRVCQLNRKRGQESQEIVHQLCLKDYRPVNLPIIIDDRVIMMEIDTGAAVSCINTVTYRNYFRNNPLEENEIIFNFYDGLKIKPVGVIRPLVSYRGLTKRLELFVIEGGTTSLLGRQWLSELKIEIPSFSNCHNICRGLISVSQNIDSLLSRFKELFSGGLGRFTGGKATLRVRDGAQPVFHRARPLPFALKDRVDAELDAMLRDGIIEPVDCSDWASPLVPVNKADGSLRICADYKATVNPVLLVDRFPLPKIEDLIVNLGRARFYSKIDLSQAYNQIELDDTKKYTVINTHRGLYRYNRLVFGLSSSPGIFQRIMCQVLRNIPNVQIFLDDVIIGGKTERDHLSALEAVFSRLQRYGLKLRQNKCVFFVNEVRYLGYILNENGIKTDPRKIEAIRQMPRPKNVTELRSFLGMINFYGKFIRNMSDRLAPLYELLKKNKRWCWSEDCETTFEKIKSVLSSADILAHYDPNRKLILTCDASGHGVGSVLSQPSDDGKSERPIAYASRTLNEAEKNYSQIHREALAIIFGVNKFHQYLYGRQFTLRTDHKPLVSIFGPNMGIPTMVASRMQRWAIILSAYNFDIEYIRSNENAADGLSRLPITGSNIESLPEQTFLHFVNDALFLDYNEIKRETSRDPVLSRVLNYLREGWPPQCDVTNLKPYFNRSNELYEELSCIMWGRRLVVPQSCKEKVLKMVHEPHMGIVKSKSIARSYVWWPGVDEDVERMCRSCEVCSSQADNPPQNVPSMWPWPNKPWTRLHLDFMGPIAGRTYLIIVDAMSKWIEVFKVSSTSARLTIDKLCEVFSRFGLPKQIVSDNGPQFACREFQNFTKNNGIEHIFTAPYHPASNGLAENAVRTLKRVIIKAIQSHEDIDRSLFTFLLHYRNVEHSTTGECPAKLMIGRHIRTRLDVIRPDREGRVFRTQQRQCKASGGGNRDMTTGELVWYKAFRGKDKWAPGRIAGRLGARDYSITTSEGNIIHRHIDQLRKRDIRSPSPQPSTSKDIKVKPACVFGPSWSPNSGSNVCSGGPTVAEVGIGIPQNEVLEPRPSTSRINQELAEDCNVSQHQTASPAASVSQGRPVRQCRLNRPPMYKH